MVEVNDVTGLCNMGDGNLKVLLIWIFYGVNMEIYRFC